MGVRGLTSLASVQAASVYDLNAKKCSHSPPKDKNVTRTVLK